MPRISADYNRMSAAAGEFKAQGERIKQIRSNIQSVMDKIPLQTTFFSAAKSRMLIECYSVLNIGYKYKEIGSTIEEIENMYKIADQRAMGENSILDIISVIALNPRILPLNPPREYWDAIRSIRLYEIVHDFYNKLINMSIYDFFPRSGIPYTTGAVEAIRNFLDPGHFGTPGLVFPLPIAALIGLAATGDSLNDDGVKWFGKLKGSYDGLFKEENDAIKDYLKSKGLAKSISWNNDSAKMGLQDDDAEQKYGKEQLDKLKEANKFMDRDAELEIVGRSKEYTYKNAAGKMENEHGSLEGSVKVGKAEGHAGAGIGAYSTKDADGNTHHGVGIYGELGGSVSALEFEGTSRLGNEYIGTYAKVDGKVLSAGATAEANFGVVDGNVQAYVGGKAEAVLGEISATGGVTVLGADVGVKATGKVGIGASASVGFKDNHFVLDAGVSLGVGGEISLDIDLNKPIEAVSDFVDGAKDFFDDVGNQVGNTLSDIGNALGDLFSW